MSSTALPRYGVLAQSEPADEIEQACESLRHLGFAVLDGVLPSHRMLGFLVRIGVCAGDNTKECKAGRRQTNSAGSH